jgi:hypothetical protein
LGGFSGAVDDVAGISTRVLCESPCPPNCPDRGSSRNVRGVPGAVPGANPRGTSISVLCVNGDPLSMKLPVPAVFSMSWGGGGGCPDDPLNR